MPDDFVDGEILTADRLNTLRTTLEQRIGSHNHTGGTNAPKLGNDSLETNAVGTAQLQDGSVTQVKLDPALYTALKDGPTTVAFFGVAQNRPLMMATKYAQALPSASAKAQPASTLPLDSASLFSTGVQGIGGTKASPPIVDPRYLQPEWNVTGVNVASVYRIQSDKDAVETPSVIHIDFVDAYRNPTYTVTPTPEWTRTGLKTLAVVKRDPKYVELTVASGKYIDLMVNFSLVIFGELES